MRLTARSEYGLLAMIELACRPVGEPVSAREISNVQQIPPRYLEQLFVALRRSGLVNAVRGARGGFTLSRPAAEMTVLDIVEALEGPLRPTICDTERAATCGRGDGCAAAEVWERATAAARDVFLSTTLQSLARKQEALDASARDL